MQLTRQSKSGTVSQLTAQHLSYSLPNVSSHHLKNESEFDDTNLGDTLTKLPTTVD